MKPCFLTHSRIDCCSLLVLAPKKICLHSNSQSLCMIHHLVKGSLQTQLSILQLRDHPGSSMVALIISSVDRIVAPVIPIKLLINLCSLEITSLAENNNSPSVQGLFKFRALAIFPPVFVPFTALPLQGRVGSIVTVFTHLTRRGSLS